jgi:menaquinone-dependent protoporphyrinogen IX oxidase
MAQQVKINRLEEEKDRFIQSYHEVVQEKDRAFKRLNDLVEKTWDRQYLENQLQEVERVDREQRDFERIRSWDIERERDR